MARRSSSLVLITRLSWMALLFLMMVGVPLLAQANITCDLASCIVYLSSTGGPVPQPCCNGVRALNADAVTTAERQAVCECLKQTAANIPGLNHDLVAALPSNCNVHLPGYKISVSIDCKTVKY